MKQLSVVLITNILVSILISNLIEYLVTVMVFEKKNELSERKSTYWINKHEKFNCDKTSYTWSETNHSPASHPMDP